MNFAKLVNLAMVCEFGNAIAKLAKWFANLAMGLRIWQCCCEVGKVVCEFGNGFANLAMGCEFGKVVCEVGNVVCEVGNAKFR